MKKLQRVLALFLVCMLLLTVLVSCESYRPRKSSKREATEVLVLGEDTVNFEVIYTFFRNRCEQIDGFTPAYFDGAEGDARYAAVMAEAMVEISEIYALFALCREVGIDPMSDEVEDSITEYLKICVEGGMINDYTLEGAGSYDDFLDAVEESYHMNDAVVRLMLRSAICENLLLEYYRTEYRFTDEDVRAFFESDSCIHLIWCNRPLSVDGFTTEENLAMMETIKDHLIAGRDDKAIQLSLNPTTEFYMGRHTKDDALYGELIDTAFSLPVGSVSDVLNLGSEGYFVIKRMPKASADFDSAYRELLPVFLNEELHEAIEAKAASSLQGIVYKDAYHELTAGDFFDK